MWIWEAIKGFLGRIALAIGSFAAGWFSGKNAEEKSQLKDQLGAANDREKIEDGNSKRGPLERRRMLSSWDVSDV
jgi:hypothetical protein